MRVACILFNYEVSLAEFAQACIRFSPQIALRGRDTLFIEIGKCNSIYSEQSFIARVQVLLKRFGYFARVEIADDLPTALAFARFNVRSVHELPLESLFDFGDPFGSDPLGRRWIEKMIASLKKLGILKIDQFKKLPSRQLPSRFGSLGLFCRQQIEGRVHQPWPHWEAPEILSERIELLNSEFCSHIEPLIFKTKEVLDRLFSRLRGKLLRAEKIRFSIELEKYSIVKVPIKKWDFEFISPQGSTSGFLPILRERLKWDLQKEPLESYVTAIHVEILATSLGLNSQKNLFHSHEERNEKMGSFFGQMEEFLGEGQIFWATLTEDRFPERSWLKSRRPRVQQISLTRRYPKRPTRIFKYPVPIFIIEDKFLIKGRQYRTKKWSSVERLSLDWLNGTFSRNYYQVDLEKGTTVWIFTDPNHNYFLHGYYE